MMNFAYTLKLYFNYFSRVENFKFKLMTFPFLTHHSLKIAHIRGTNRGSDNGQMIDLSHLTARLIVLHEKLNILNILEFYISQVHWIAFQIFPS